MFEKKETQEERYDLEKDEMDEGYGTEGEDEETQEEDTDNGSITDDDY